MNIVLFLLHHSWVTVAIAGLAGFISGTCSAGLIALINNAIATGSSDRLLLGFIGLAIAAVLTSLTSQFLLAKLSYEAIYQMRLRLSGTILACPLRHLEQLGANRILATLTEDTVAISETLAFVPFLCIDAAVILGCLVYLCWLSWQVFLITIAFLAIGIILLQLLIAKAHGFIQRARELQDDLFKQFRTITDGIKELKLNARRRQAFMNEELEMVAIASRDFNIASMRIFSLSTTVGQLIFFTTIGMLVFGLPKINAIEPRILMGYVLVIMYLLEPVGRVLQMLPGLSRGNVALDKLRMLGLTLASESEAIASKVEAASNFDRIELIDVTHTYRNDREKSFILGPIGLIFSPGELVFIVGGNGSGKSTLAKIVAGLYMPESGEIRWNGQPVTERNQENYRQLFSTVFSDFYLFERFLGLQSLDLTLKAQAYLQQFQLDRKVTIDGDRLSTIELSQGQRKRLALLTAYLEDRPIYIFDEWAADQDPFFREIFYTQLLPELKNRGKTVLVISHDDRYYHLSDRILKLDYGNLVV